MYNRVRTLRKQLNLTQQAMASRLGIGKSALSMIETGKASLSDRNKKILIQEFGVNRQWLETGEGIMLDPQSSVKTFYPGRGKESTSQYVPLYGIDGQRSMSELFSGINVTEPKDFILIPELPNCDGAVHIYGESMYPILQSGDIVLYKIIENIEEIVWGEMYILSMRLDGDEFVTVRYIHEGRNIGTVRLSGSNPSYDDQEIEASRLLALGMVKASIRFNTGL